MTMTRPTVSSSTGSQTDVPGPSHAKGNRKEGSNVSSYKPMTEDQLQEYEEAFREFDKDGNGTISVDELSLLVRELGYDQKEESIQHLVREFDIDENGVIDFDEFVQLMQNQIQPMNSEELIYEAFQNIGGPDGTISRDALKEKASELGLNFTDEELQEMIEEAAPDDEGKLSYQGLIEFMSGGNETLWDAYTRRKDLEEKQKIKDEERRQAADQEAGDTISERVPDIDEIASQFDRSNYDEYSRQTNGRRLVKKPGKRVPMSKTRMQFLKRKAEAEGRDVEELVGVREAEQNVVRTSTSSKELWPGTIHDDKTFDTKFKSNPPRAYKHVESRLHAPSQRPGRQPHVAKPSSLRDRNTNKDSKGLVLQAAVVTDFDKELRKIQQSKDTKQHTKTSSNMFPMKPTLKSSLVNTEKINFKQSEGYLARKKQKDALRGNYNMWKMFFEKAVRQIKEAKHKIDKIENALDTGRLGKDTNYTQKFKRNSERLNLRPNVITPTLENSNVHQLKINSNKPMSDRKPHKQSSLVNGSNQTMSKSKSDTNIGQKKSKDTYVGRFRERRGLSVTESSDDLSTGTQESTQFWRPPKKNVAVISKESLEFYF